MGGYGRFFMCLKSRWGRGGGGLGMDGSECTFPPLFLGLRAHGLGLQKLMHVLTVSFGRLLETFLGGALVVYVTCVCVGGELGLTSDRKGKEKELTRQEGRAARGDKNRVAENGLDLVVEICKVMELKRRKRIA